MANTNIGQFAAGGVTTSDDRWDPQLATTLIQYLERESDFRKFAKTVTIQNTFSYTIPVKYEAGIAVEVVEGAEIPKFRDVYDKITVNVIQNGTGIRMTEEEQLLMAWEPDYFQKEATAAMRRILKKENKDIAEVLMAGAGIEKNISGGLLLWEDIVDFKAEMEDQEYMVEPGIILMSPFRYNDLVKDPMFRDYSQSGIGGVLESGQVGRKVADMTIYIIPEVGDSVYLIDQTLEPLWLVQMGQANVYKYFLDETREDVLDITIYEKPVVVRIDAIGRLVIGP